MNRLGLMQIALMIALMLVVCDMVRGEDSVEGDGPRVTKASTFVMFNGLILESDRPVDLSMLGMKPIQIMSPSSLWDTKNGQDYFNTDLNRYRAYARYLKRHEGIVCLDIEHYQTDARQIGKNGFTKQKLDRNIKMFKTIVDVIHQAEPELRIGYYLLLPVRDYWSPVYGHEKDIEKWQKANDALMPLADSVDVLFPSFYTFNNDPVGWLKYAKANMEQSRRFHKPVYVFLYPKYHESNKELGGTLIDGEFWAKQLEFVYENADGVVIWGPFKKHEWGPGVGWWDATVKFVEKIKEE
ncbi:hypothetical protein KS4_03210 [Poriferisphaera corsica]|uniref:Hyaluronidase n=1 Tax=Poriferisphaera corsica TaxID=2528020 RepID=A0A517YPZ6_9BACT|nr:hypothetical protein [Poriferisphaera corsica]QDU32290.1 hypothetical protein KS4_03210 [Poriferisphaera corsica]